MESVIFSGKSKEDIQLLMQIAGRMNIKTRILTEADFEDLGLAAAIKEGETGEYINTDELLGSLK